jgi:hypothetical protein
MAAELFTYVRNSGNPINWDLRKKTHIAQALHNEELLDYVETELGNDFLDWMMTAIFYVCVHYVDARLATRHRIVSDHIQRGGEVANLFMDIRKEYHRTYKESRWSRYDPEYRNYTNSLRVASYKVKMQLIKASVPP